MVSKRVLSWIDSVVPENIHTPPTERIGNSWGVGGSQRPQNLRKCMKLDWNFQRGLPWGKYGTTHWMRHCQWEPLAFSLIGFECNQNKASCQGKQYITTKTLLSSPIVHEKFAIWYKLQHHTWSPTSGS